MFVFLPNSGCRHLLEPSYNLQRREFRFASYHHVQVVFVGFHDFNVKVGHVGYVLHDLLHVIFYRSDKQFFPVFAYKYYVVLDKKLRVVL